MNSPLVGASPGPASDPLITFGYLLLDRDLGVGKGAMVEVHDVLAPSGPDGRLVRKGSWVMLS